MILTLIGMSGSGKSYWSSKLAEYGFRRLGCDDRIAARLNCKQAEAVCSVDDVGRWMGFPYERDYQEREDQYLRCEVEAMKGILEEIVNVGDSATSGVVIDTTGSVIYTGRDILEALRACSTVVHLAAPEAVQRLMLASYVRQPRPVLWHGFFRKEPMETNEAALARCYPVLLASRETRYRQLAHVTLDYHDHRIRFTTVQELLDQLRTKGFPP
jgi:shikimate kinase